MLVFRKNTPSFHSIENVFVALLTYLNVEIFELPHKSLGLLNRLRNIRFLQRHKTSFIHITGYDHYLLWFPFKNAILTIHDIEALKRKKGWKRWLFKKLWFDLPIYNAKVVTTISSFSKNEIESLGNYKTSIKVIYNPLTLPLAYSPKTFNQQKPRILQIGTKNNKNIERLVEALNGLSVELVVVGKLNEEQNELLEKSGVSVENLIGISNETMMETYRSCDILAFVSTYEGFGLPILEAQAIGRPVLTSLVASMPEVAGEGALLVDPCSVAEIRVGIKKLIENQDLRDDLIQKGLENVKRFEVENIANQYVELYKELQ